MLEKNESEKNNLLKVGVNPEIMKNKSAATFKL